DGVCPRQRCRHQGVGQLGRSPLPGAAGTARRHRWAVRGGARGSCHTRLHDRRGPAVKLDVDGPGAPPRSNGELIFDAPWQARVFGLAAAVVETRFAGDREPFRQRLIAAIAADPERPYWDSWAMALEELATADGLLPPGAVDRRVAAGRKPAHP